MAKRTPDFKEYPSWSEARFFGFLRSALRAAFRRWGPKYEVYKRAQRPAEYEWWNAAGTRKLNVKHEFQCAECSEWFMRKEVECDHIVPVGSLRKFEDLPGFCERMFVGPDKMRILCTTCHQKVTKEQRTKKS